MQILELFYNYSLASVDCTFNARVKKLLFPLFSSSLSSLSTEEEKPEATEHKVCWKRLSSRKRKRRNRIPRVWCDFMRTTRSDCTEKTELDDTSQVHGSLSSQPERDKMNEILRLALLILILNEQKIMKNASCSRACDTSLILREKRRTKTNSRSGRTFRVRCNWNEMLLLVWVSHDLFNITRPFQVTGDRFVRKQSHQLECISVIDRRMCCTFINCPLIVLDHQSNNHILLSGHESEIPASSLLACRLRRTAG